MIEIDAAQHLFRYWRYQFQPSTFDASINSQEGIAQVGVNPVSVQLGSDAANYIAISNSTSGMLYCPVENSMQVGWLFTMYSGFSVNDNYMKCRVTAIGTSIAYPTQINFTAYESSGSGSFDSWYIESNLRGSLNYVQNFYPSAVASKDRAFVGTARFSFPGPLSETITTVVSDTATNKSGYYTLNYTGVVNVVEDEYDYNRPYDGITVELTRKRKETTTVATTTYDTSGNPTTTTTVNVVDASPLINSHTFTIDDFYPSSSSSSPGGIGRTYYPGDEIPNPSPSVCENIFDLGTTFEGSYNRIYEEHVGPPPDYIITYRIVSNTTVGLSFDPDDGDGTMTIDPAYFFPL